jgi:exodeoxyribonuclease VII small subunit
VGSKSNAASAATPEASFEDAMHRLEAIVEAMEAGDVPLGELLAKYEEGSRLLALCEQRLKAAELKIEQLKRQKDGSLAPDPFPAGERSDLGLA